MRSLQAVLEETYIIGPGRLDDLRRYIHMKYPEAPETECARVFSHAVHQALNAHLQTLPENLNTPVKDALLRSLIADPDKGIHYQAAMEQTLRTVCTSSPKELEQAQERITQWLAAELTLDKHTASYKAYVHKKAAHIAREVKREQENKRLARQAAIGQRLRTQMDQMRESARAHQSKQSAVIENAQVQAVRVETEAQIGHLEASKPWLIQFTKAVSLLQRLDAPVRIRSTSIQLTAFGKALVRIAQVTARKINRDKLRENRLYLLSFTMSGLLMLSLLPSMHPVEPIAMTKHVDVMQAHEQFQNWYKHTAGNQGVTHSVTLEARQLLPIKQSLVEQSKQFKLPGTYNPFPYEPFDVASVRIYLREYNSLLAETPHFETIIEVGIEKDVDPRLLFAITGQEQSFVQRNSQRAHDIIRNPFNVFVSWKRYNTSLKDSATIAANTVRNTMEKTSPEEHPLQALNDTYAEDPRWWIGVDYFYQEMLKLDLVPAGELAQRIQQ